MIRLALCAAASLCLSCSTPKACLAAPANQLAVSREVQRTSADQLCLQGYEWDAKGAPRGVLVVVHGLRDHATRYGGLIEAATAKGFIVVAQDHRGHGRSGGARQRYDVDQLVEDVDLEVEAVRAAHPGLPVFMFGHSLGGLVTTRSVLAHGEKLSGFLLSGPALKVLDSVTGGQKAAARFFGVLAPGLAAQALDDTTFVRTPDAKADLAADPLVQHDNLPAASARSTLNAIDDTEPKLATITLPFLVMHGTADTATNPAGSQLLFDQAKSTDKTFKKYEGVSHDLLHEPEKDQVLTQMIGWLEAHAPAKE